jgi:hypothetical protein
MFFRCLGSKPIGARSGRVMTLQQRPLFLIQKIVSCFHPLGRAIGLGRLNPAISMSGR